MDVAVWQIVLGALVIAWLGGATILYLRYRARRRAYLHRLPPVKGVPLDLFVPGGGPLSVQRAIYRAMWQRQADPEQERLRRAMWRILLAMTLWLLGFALVVAGVTERWLQAGGGR